MEWEAPLQHDLHFPAPAEPEEGRLRTARTDTPASQSGDPLTIDDSSFRIRPFTMSDYAPVVDLWLHAGLRLGPGDAPAEVERKLATDADLFLVAEGTAADADATPASIIGSVVGGWDGRQGWIYHLAVRPEFQRLGIGRALLQEVERRLAARGCRKVNLHVRAGNGEARSLYEALGYGASPELVVMGKHL